MAEAILFTERCEEAITKGSLRSLLTEMEAQLDSFTSVDLSASNEEEGGEDNKVLDLKLKALILDTIHNIEVVNLLITQDVRSKGDWLWQKQLRLG